MGRKRLVNLDFPLAGLDKRYAYQKQKPYTTPDCLNVRPEAALQGRLRGGSRPGLAKSFYSELGSGNPVRMLGQVRAVPTSTANYWQDDFEGMLDAPLDPEIWTVENDTTMDREDYLWKLDGDGRAYLDPNQVTPNWLYPASIASRDILADVDDSYPYTVSMFCDVPPVQRTDLGFGLYTPNERGTPLGDRVGAHFMSQALLPEAWTRIIMIIFAIVDGNVIYPTQGNDEQNNRTLYTSSLLIPGAVFSLTVSGNTVTVTYGEYFSDTVEIPELSDASFEKYYFSGDRPPENKGLEYACAKIDWFRVDYTSTTSGPANTNYLTASSNGLVYAGTGTSLSQVTLDATLASDRNLQAAPRAGKLYIADWSEETVSGSGTIAGAGDDELDDAGIDDWTDYANADDYVVVLTGAGITNGTYRISAVDADKVTLTTSPGSGACTYKIVRGLKVFDPIAETMTVLAETASTVPDTMPLIAVYRDRLTLAGNPDTPHIWYMSRQGDPGDFDYSQTDVRRAVAGIAADAGQHAEPITALVPYSDDYLIFGCINSLWMLIGDPSYSDGYLTNLSYKTGVLSAQAWCHTPEGYLYFFGRSGLYAIRPGPGNYPEALSREKLPRELQQIDPATHDVFLEYDNVYDGIHVYVTPASGATYVHYWYNITNGSFWPVTLQSDHHPTALMSYDANSPSYAKVLLGCRDGYIRSYGDRNDTDDGIEFTSYATIGPIRLGANDYMDGKLIEVLATLAKNSGDVTWTLYVADTGEEVVTASSFDSGTWSENANYKIRPRARGNAMLLKITGTGTKWAVEQISAVIETAGKRRLV